MITAKIGGTDGILSYLGSIGAAISRSGYKISEIYEIRIRAGRKVVLETEKGRTVIDKNADMTEIADCVKNFCEHSLHSFAKELKEGFITLKGGTEQAFAVRQ